MLDDSSLKVTTNQIKSNQIKRNQTKSALYPKIISPAFSHSLKASDRDILEKVQLLKQISSSSNRTDDYPDINVG